MEANNMKAMREALKQARVAMVAVVESVGGEENEEVLKAIDAALAEPPRQCDVGTPEEQNKRLCSNFFSVRQCGSFTHTALVWAQTPYNESDATDGK